MALKTLIRNIDEILTLAPAMQQKGRGIKEESLGVFKNYAFLIENGRISWIGPQRKIPKKLASASVKEISMQGRSVCPGFIECHTHTVFAGNRADEFEMRNQGASYQEISAKGGGILSTVKATRKINAKELLKLTQERVNRFLQQGVTSLEIKSGYGLNLKDEVKCLEIVKKLQGPHCISTFLGAHAKPPEYSSYEEYLIYLAEKVLPIIKKKKLAERVDVFIENGFFPAAAAKEYLRRAQELGFKITIHADQLSLSGGSKTAVELKALSADHVIQVGDAEISALANSETTCVLLPAADLYMKCDYPPARKLIDSGARVALATDFNPGTSPTQDIDLVGLLARLEMKMTLPEVISAYTVAPAFALGIESEKASLEVGKAADFLCIDGSWNELFYSVGQSIVAQVFIHGKKVINNSQH